VRRLWLLALVGAVSCSRCSCESRPLNPAEVQSVRLTGAGLEARRLPITKLSLTERGEGLWLHLVAARPPRLDEGPAVHALVLETWLRPEGDGPVSGALEGSRCAVRYLFGGRETEVDFGLTQASGRDKTLSGAAHAPGLPDELVLDFDAAL
jgi:hypothetical protein